MTIPTEYDDTVRFGAAQQLEESLAFLGDQCPLLERMFVAQQLNAGADQSQIGRDFQLFLEPLPLFLAEERCPWIVVRDRWRDAGPRVELAALHFAAEVATIEHNHLDALTDRPEKLRVVNALLRTARRIGRHAEEVQKHLLGIVFENPLGPRVVLAVVVIVPRRHHRHGLLQRRKRRQRIEFVVLRADEFPRDFLRLVEVRIDRVAEQNE